MSWHRPGFTMLELLVATILGVILTGGVLFITAGIARDRQRMEQRGQVQSHAGVGELIVEPCSAPLFGLANDRGRKACLRTLGQLFESSGDTLLA